MKLRSLPMILHSTEGGEGGKKGEASASPPPPDLAKIADDLIKKHGGDQGAAVRAVLAERDQALGQVAELRGKLPREGHVVIDPDRARLLSDYEALGHKPADLKAALGERDELGKWKAGRERQDFLGEVATLVKWKPNVLGKLADGLEIVVRDEKDPKDASKTIKVPYVKTTGKGDDPKAEVFTPLTKHAESHWADYLPALAAEPKPAIHPLGSPPAANGAPRPPVVATGERIYPNFAK